MPTVRGVNYSEPHVRYRGERILNLAKKLLTEPAKLPEYFDENLAVSLYYTFFLPNPIVSTPNKNDQKTITQYMILNTVLSSPKLRQIKLNTIADSTTSTVASAVMIEHLVRTLSQRQSVNQGGETKKQSSGREAENLDKEIQKAVEKALENIDETTKQIKEMENLSTKFTAGTASTLSFEEVISDVINLAKNTDVKILLEALKTLEDTESYVKIRKRPSPRGELDGYEKGSDIERIAPAELATPVDLFLVKYMERGLLIYRKIVVEEYGPFYVLLDKSGSMMGMKSVWAKAVALAIAQRAVREGREFFIRFFDSIPYPSLHIPRRVKAKDVVKLLEYLARIRANGGTDITRAIMAAVEDIVSISSKKRPADIILITDGEDRVSVDLIRKGLAKSNASLHTVMIHGNNPDLRALSTRYFVAIKLDKEEALKVLNIEEKH